MTQVVINNLFYKTKLDGNIKGRIFDFIGKLTLNPDGEGLDLKRPKGAVNPAVRTARVTDFWRAVLFALPDSAGFVLVTVKPHDEAYKYAAKLRLEVNRVTGALELIDQLAIDVAVDRAVQPEPPKAEEQPRPPLLADVSVSDLARFGMDDSVAEKALQITADQLFEELCDALPHLQGCALLDLRAGKDVDQVVSELLGEEDAVSVDTDDIMAALDRPVTKLSFASGSHEELLAAIEGDFSAWRVWLHPQQRRLANHNGWNGPARVTGGAGTGKTVTALHRAHHLAERSSAADLRQPAVLFTTFTKNLAASLTSQLQELGGGDVLDRVDVIHIDALAQRVLREGRAANGRAEAVALVGDDHRAVKEAWVLAAAGTEWTPDFLHAEWNDVVLAQGVADQSAYFKAPRTGRGVPLNRAKRAKVWQAIESAQRHLALSKVLTFRQAASNAADLAERGAGPRYAHAVIDEAQDLHPAHWRLIRALVPDGKDDIFLVGDAHQRIYGRPLVLSRYGIRTTGRSYRLTINYRTSEQILRWSVGVMSSADIDDMEGETEDLAGSRSEFAGPTPERIQCSSPAEEDAKLAEIVRGWIEGGYETDRIGVLSHGAKGVESACRALNDHGINAAVIARDNSAQAGQVQVMTMHRAKGLEFRCVAITRLGEAQSPLPWLISQNPEQAAFLEAQERSLLYVAGTRARERLALIYSNDPSGLLP